MNTPSCVQRGKGKVGISLGSQAGRMPEGGSLEFLRIIFFLIDYYYCLE